MTYEEFEARYDYNPETDNIGHGGFGYVYKARDHRRNRWVAIKECEVKPDKFTLKREVELVAELGPHDNIARYENNYRFKHGRSEKDYAVMYYYEEGSLATVLEKYKHILSDAERAEIIKGLLAGLGFIHQEGFIHRDFKPGNVLMLKEQGRWIPKITDFGMSKFKKGLGGDVTNNSATAKTLSYSAPEQIQNRPIKDNTDLWALGVTVYKMCTGHLPYKSEATTSTEAYNLEISRQIIAGKLPNMVGIKKPFDSIIEQCLVFDMDKRVQSAAELLSFLSTPIVKPDPKPEIPAETKVIIETYPAEDPTDLGQSKAEKPVDDLPTDIPDSIAKPQQKESVLNEVIPSINIQEATDSNLIVFRETGKLLYGFKTKRGEVIVPFEYEQANGFTEGLAGVKKDGKWGVINKLNKHITPFIYEDIKAYSEGRAAVKINGKWGYVDRLGIMMVPAEYWEAGLFKKGVAEVKYDLMENRSVEINKFGVAITKTSSLPQHLQERADYFSTYINIGNAYIELWTCLNRLLSDSTPDAVYDVLWFDSRKLRYLGSVDEAIALAEKLSNDINKLIKSIVKRDFDDQNFKRKLEIDILSLDATAYNLISLHKYYYENVTSISLSSTENILKYGRTLSSIDACIELEINRNNLLRLYNAIPEKAESKAEKNIEDSSSLKVIDFKMDVTDGIFHFILKNKMEQSIDSLVLSALVKTTTNEFIELPKLVIPSEITYKTQLRYFNYSFSLPSIVSSNQKLSVQFFIEKIVKNSMSQLLYSEWFEFNKNHKFFDASTLMLPQSMIIDANQWQYYKVNVQHNKKLVVKTDKYGWSALFQEDDTQLTPFEYSKIAIIENEPFIKVSIKHKWGLINKKGKEVIPIKYDLIREFVNGRAAVKQNGLWGFIDQEGKEAIPCIYSTANDFDKDEVAEVFLPSKGVWSFLADDKRMWIDKNGKTIAEYVNDKVEIKDTRYTIK